MVKEIKDLAVGESFKSKAGTVYVIRLHCEDGISVLASQEQNGMTVYSFEYNCLIKEGYTFDKPLSVAEKGAKALLEAIGFKVTR